MTGVQTCALPICESTHKFAADPDLIGKVRQAVGVPVRYVHVIRHPLDNIATMSRKHNLTLDAAVERYFKLCQTNQWVKTQVPAAEFMDVRLDDMTARPQEQLTKLCEFLGLQVTPDYLADCATLVFSAPRQSRGTVSWTPQAVDGVRAEAEQFTFLNGYRFDPAPA